MRTKKNNLKVKKAKGGNDRIFKIGALDQNYTEINRTV